MCYPCLIWVCFLWCGLCVQDKEGAISPVAGRSLLMLKKRIKELEHELEEHDKGAPLSP